MRINHEELKDLFKHFRWIDNIPEDQNRRDEICVEARAALLLEANINSEMMPAFLRREKVESQYYPNRYKLPHPVSFEIVQTRGNVPYGKTPRPITLQHFDFGGKDDKMGKLWRPAQEIENNTIFYEAYDELGDDKISDSSIDGSKFNANFYQNYPSFYSICKDITPYGTPEEICRFWGCSGEPFGKIKVRNMRPDHIWKTASGIPAPGQEVCPDPRYVQDQRNFPQLIPCQSPLLTDLFLDDRYQDDWYCQVFSFRNEYGEKIMKLIKVYDEDAQNKYLLPVTTWIRNNSI